MQGTLTRASGQLPLQAVAVALPKVLSVCYQATQLPPYCPTGWWLFRTLLVPTEPTAPVPGRTCPAHLDALLARAVSGPLAEPTRTRRRLYEEMGAQLARSGLSLGMLMSFKTELRFPSMPCAWLA